MSGGPASIELQDLGYLYPGSGGAGVRGIDLTIGAGELLAVIGPSGCGKSTLLKLIAGFLRPDRGRVRIGGEDVTLVAPRERNLGVVFQSYALFPHMTAWQNVAYPLKARGVPAAKRREEALRALDRVGLADLAARRPGDMSGGQQQRVALARALVFHPRALLLDEPLSALDAALRLETRDEIQRLQREHGIATIHVTHDQEEALSIADRVAVMRAGRLEQVAPPREIYERPASREVAAFVGHANLWDGKIAGPDTVETPIGAWRTSPSHGYAAGSAVTVLVRPERVRVGAAPDGVNSFAGRVSRDRFLGAVRRFDFSTPRGILVGETAEPGEITAVHVPPAHVQLIPARERGP